MGFIGNFYTAKIVCHRKFYLWNYGFGDLHILASEGQRPMLVASGGALIRLCLC
jgi:hypothetical protein